MVCVLITWNHGYAVQNSWTDRDVVWGLNPVYSRNRVLDGVEIPTERGNFGELYGPLKSTEFLLRCTQRKGSFNPHITAWQPTAMLPIGRCNITLPRVKLTLNAICVYSRIVYFAWCKLRFVFSCVPVALLRNFPDNVTIRVIIADITGNL